MHMPYSSLVPRPLLDFLHSCRMSGLEMRPVSQHVLICFLAARWTWNLVTLLSGNTYHQRRYCNSTFSQSILEQITIINKTGTPQQPHFLDISTRKQESLHRMVILQHACTPSTQPHSQTPLLQNANIAISVRVLKRESLGKRLQNTFFKPSQL